MSGSDEQILTSRLEHARANKPLKYAIIVFVAIALYNACELLVLITLTFRRYRTLYFWALLTSTMLGVIPATLGPMMQYFDLGPLWLALVLSNVGFVMMVPNQSVVLYSRLHLVSQSTRMLSFVRWLIVFSLVAIAIPTIVLDFGWSYIPESAEWKLAFDVIERIQVTWFTVQECFISAVYIWETVRLIKLSPEQDKRRTLVLYELFAINVTFIIMDLSLVIIEYLGYYFAQIILKAAVYSIKLKMEFAVLGMLVSIVHSHSSGRPSWQADCTMIDIPRIRDPNAVSLVSSSLGDLGNTQS
ncbi:hypothetical protein PHISCL_09267 [Aspergillus sclerotialis]|uniref:DUF7703 domain-containing protein n=1 Tax=Aspergillus sclerotialis TaxID=2070753 RepID=A0A3A2Z5M1_9EURO|nr:hypothetical protein PHISCL_09267 [Aspergillus sclerotialis]